MKKILYIVTILLLTMHCTDIMGQSVIKGKVTSSTDGSAAESAMVRLLSGTKIIGYCITDENGAYSVKANSKEPKITICFEHMSFKKKSLTIDNKSQTLNITLDESVTSLKEVTVKAPSVIQKGDTLLFNIAQFVSKGDLTLEDALKKIPGIDIAQDGQIRYMNKSISNFYIEGLDMLGGKYTIATKNIPKEYVNSVEVVNNYKDKKMDKNNISDDVAINIKLSNKAKLKPVGTSALTAGYGDKMLYQAELMGMLFLPKIQNMLTAKYGNVRQFSLKETNDFFNPTILSVPASSVQGSLGGSRPPLAVDRYVDATDATVSANAMKKINDDETMKASITYAYDKTEYEYSSESRYLNPEDNSFVVFNEAITPGSRIHKPVLDLEYKNNSVTNFLSNTFSVIGNFTENTMVTERTDNTLSQKKKADMVALRNRFSNSFYIGKKKLALYHTIEYITAPTADMTIKGTDDTWNAFQDGKARRLNTTGSTGVQFTWGDFKLNVPLSIGYTYDDSKVLLQRNSESMLNQVYSNDLRITSNISLELTTKDRKCKMELRPEISGIIFDQKNSATALKLSSSYLNVNPMLSVMYKFTPLSTLSLIGSKNRTLGDVMNLFNAPVMSNYRTMNIKSGIINKSNKYNCILSYNYASSLKMLWFDTSNTYTHYTNNVMNESDVDETLLKVTQRLAPSSSDIFLTKTTLTKQFMKIGTKITLSAFYRHTDNEALRNGTNVNFKTNEFGFQPRLSIHPVKPLEINYNSSIIKTKNNYNNQDVDYLSQEHSTNLKVYPAENVTLSAQWDFLRKYISNDNYKSMSLLDFSASVLHKRIRYTLSLNNALNTRHYAYNGVSGFDNYGYDFKLRGRELLFSISFTQ